MVETGTQLELTLCVSAFMMDKSAAEPCCAGDKNQGGKMASRAVPVRFPAISILHLRRLLHTVFLAVLCLLPGSTRSCSSARAQGSGPDRTVTTFVWERRVCRYQNGWDLVINCLQAYFG